MEGGEGGGGSLEGHGEFSGLRLLAFVAVEVGEQLANQAAQLAVCDVEGSETSDHVPIADAGVGLLRLLHLRRPNNLYNDGIRPLRIQGPVSSSSLLTLTTWLQSSKSFFPSRPTCALALQCQTN
jgi:hypothetical protein